MKTFFKPIGNTALVGLGNALFDLGERQRQVRLTNALVDLQASHSTLYNEVRRGSDFDPAALKDSYLENEAQVAEQFNIRQSERPKLEQLRQSHFNKIDTELNRREVTNDHIRLNKEGRDKIRNLRELMRDGGNKISRTQLEKIAVELSSEIASSLDPVQAETVRANTLNQALELTFQWETAQLEALKTQEELFNKAEMEAKKEADSLAWTKQRVTLDRGINALKNSIPTISIEEFEPRYEELKRGLSALSRSDEQQTVQGGTLDRSLDNVKAKFKAQLLKEQEEEKAQRAKLEKIQEETARARTVGELTNHLKELNKRSKDDTIDLGDLVQSVELAVQKKDELLEQGISPEEEESLNLLIQRIGLGELQERKTEGDAVAFVTVGDRVETFDRESENWTEAQLDKSAEALMKQIADLPNDNEDQIREKQTLLDQLNRVVQHRMDGLEAEKEEAEMLKQNARFNNVDVKLNRLNNISHTLGEDEFKKEAEGVLKEILTLPQDEEDRQKRVTSLKKQVQDITNEYYSDTVRNAPRYVPIETEEAIKADNPQFKDELLEINQWLANRNLQPGEGEESIIRMVMDMTQQGGMDEQDRVIFRGAVQHYFFPDQDTLPGGEYDEELVQGMAGVDAVIDDPEALDNYLEQNNREGSSDVAEEVRDYAAFQGALAEHEGRTKFMEEAAEQKLSLIEEELKLEALAIIEDPTRYREAVKKAELLRVSGARLTVEKDRELRARIQGTFKEALLTGEAEEFLGEKDNRANYSIFIDQAKNDHRFAGIDTARVTEMARKDWQSEFNFTSKEIVDGYMREERFDAITYNSVLSSDNLSTEDRARYISERETVLKRVLDAGRFEDKASNPTEVITADDASLYDAYWFENGGAAGMLEQPGRFVAQVNKAGFLTTNQVKDIWSIIASGEDEQALNMLTSLTSLNPEVLNSFSPTQAQKYFVWKHSGKTTGPEEALLRVRGKAEGFSKAVDEQRTVLATTAIVSDTDFSTMEKVLDELDIEGAFGPSTATLREDLIEQVMYFATEEGMDFDDAKEAGIEMIKRNWGKNTDGTSLALAPSVVGVPKLFNKEKGRYDHAWITDDLATSVKDLLPLGAQARLFTDNKTIKANNARKPISYAVTYLNEFGVMTFLADKDGVGLRYKPEPTQEMLEGQAGAFTEYTDREPISDATSP